MDPLREANFLDYKKAEQKALGIVREMKSVSAKKVDIELALIVALFELHKDELPAGQIATIIQDHMKSLVPFYSGGEEVAVTPLEMAMAAQESIENEQAGIVE